MRALPKRGQAFYGDVGTKFTGNAREDIEKQESSGAGHPGNNVDFSQRTSQSESVGRGKRGNFYSVMPGDDDSLEGLKRDLEDNSSHGDEGAGSAQSEADEYTDQAARMTRSMEHSNIPLGMPREQFIEELAERLRGKPATTTQPQAPEEKPFSSNEFWSNPEEVKKAGRAVRPPRL